MKPELVVIDTAEGVRELRSYLTDKDFVAYDCETTGLNKSAEVIGFSVCAEETKAYYVILAKWNVAANALVYYNAVREESQGLIEDLKSHPLLMHNAIFDCAMAENYFKIRLIDSLHTDTMVLAHLLDENRRKGLKELGKLILGEDAGNEAEEMKASVLANGGMLTKKCYEMYKADPHLMGKYGAKDAWMTYCLFFHFVPELYAQNLDKFFYEDESMPLLKGPTYELNTTGLQIDTKALTELKKTLEAECLEAKAFIYREIDSYIKDKYPGTNKKNTFNIGASQQLSWLLFGQMKLEFGTLTAGGKNICKALMNKLPYKAWEKRSFIEQCTQHAGLAYEPESIVNGKKRSARKYKQPWAYIACDKPTLKKYADQYEWIKKLLDYQRKTKLLTTYVEGIQSRMQYGVIYPSFLQAGTSSGRYASRDPNFQNLPRDDKRIKQCTVARPSKVFVGADYSQLEPRVFAYFSGDERLLAVFKTDQDFYSTIGMEVFDKFDCTPYKEGSPDAFGVKYKKLRDDSKVIALASVYGATGHQLAKTTGKSVEDTQGDIDNYFERFPGVAKLMLDSHAQAKAQGYVTNLFGRPRRMPEAKRITKMYGNLAHADLPYEARSLLNLAVNHRIQSTAASIVNRAAIRLYTNLRIADIKAKFVAQVHDSLVIECNSEDAWVVKLLMQDAMENTIDLTGIDLEAVPKSGLNLAEV